MNQPPTADLLTANHEFPGPYQFKVIGLSDEDFESRTLAAVRTVLGPDAPITHNTRRTPNDKHVSLTIHIQADTPEQVIAIYTQLHTLQGLHLLF